MTNGLKTFDKAPGHLYRGFFRLDLVHILLYLMSGFALLILIEVRPIWRYLNSQVLGVVPIQGDNFFNLTNIDEYLNIWGNFSGSRLVQIMLWAVIGIWVYVLIWFLVNILTNVYNDVMADKYVHPRTYRHSAYWANVLGLKALLLAALSVSLIYVVIGVRLMSELGQIFYLALENFDWPHSPAIWMITILASATLLYVFTVLLHITFSTGRTIYKGL